MPDTSQIAPIQFSCKGGLVLNKSVFDMQPGEALNLINFEPAIGGGYRRITGTTTWNTNAVSGTGKILMTAILGTKVIAARGPNVEHSSTGSGSWTSITTGRTGANRYDFDRFNFSGTDKLVFADNNSAAATWDGSSYVLLNGAIGSGSGTAPTSPSFVKAHKNHIFLLDGTTLTFSSPYSENNFTPISGAGEIALDAIGTGLKSFRDILYIFTIDHIYKLMGNNRDDFTLLPVARNIGCLSNFSIQEIGGDIIFLGPDGLRTVAATEKLGDVELASFSRNIHPRFSDISDMDIITSNVIRGKTQYRLFYPLNSAEAEAQANGIIAGFTKDQWEFGDLLGIKPSCGDSFFISNIETIIHGGWDGKVYKQESGNDINGTAMSYEYRSPDLTFGDPGIRKGMQRVIANIRTEGLVTFNLGIEYDFNSTGTPQPSTRTVTIDPGDTYGVGVYGTAIYGGTPIPLKREIVVGSGFTVAVKVTANTSQASYTLKGFQLEASPGGRR